LNKKITDISDTSKLKKYLYTPTGIRSNKQMWSRLFKKYVNRKSDLETLWNLISLKMYDLLIKKNYVRIPNIGTIAIKIVPPKRPTYLYNEKPKFNFPFSKIVFTPSHEIRKLFENKKFTMSEIQQLEEGGFDWIKKSGDKTRY